MITRTTSKKTAIITLDRPEKRNAISPTLARQLSEAIEAVADEPDVSVVILRAEGPTFCAGYDLAGRYADGDRPDNPWTDREHLRRMTELHETVWNCPIPVLAAVQGACLAGGADLALHCDFIFMADDAYLGYPPVRFLGTPPTNMWLYRVGLQRSRRALLTGDPLTAQEALACGLATAVTETHELDDTTQQFADRIGETGRELLMSNKWVLNRGVDLMGRDMLNRVARTEDALAHTSPASVGFKKAARTGGLKAALRSQREP